MHYTPAEISTEFPSKTKKNQYCFEEYKPQGCMNFISLIQ